jgi:hypothetical protein
MEPNPTPTRQLTMERKPLAWVKPYAGNAKLHPPEQVAKLVASIRRFGFNSPLLTLEDGTLVAGHGRLAAAQAAGLADVPVVILVGMGMQDARAYALADNRLADLGTWDAEALESELLELQEADPGALEAAGYTGADIEQLLEQIKDGEGDGDGLEDEGPLSQVCFTLHREQAEIVEAALERAKDSGLGISAVNEDWNGNALYNICRAYLDGKAGPQA